MATREEPARGREDSIAAREICIQDQPTAVRDQKKMEALKKKLHTDDDRKSLSRLNLKFVML